VWYGIIGLGCALGVLFLKYQRDVGKLQKRVEKQNQLLSENIAQLRDEYARVFSEIKKVKK